MMGGGGSTYGGYGMMDEDDWGMMGGTSSPEGGSADKSSDAPSGPGLQEDGSGFTPGSMMGGSAYANDSANDGWGMMGGTSIPNPGPSNQGGQGGNTPSDPGPPVEDSSPAYDGPAFGGMMGGGMIGTGMMGR